jgi:hypothetical protein
MPDADTTRPDGWGLQAEEEELLEPLEESKFLPDLSMGREEEKVKIVSLLKQKVEEAVQAGAPKLWAERLEKLLLDHLDTFRLVLGRDPPVKVTHIVRGAPQARSQASAEPRKEIPT